MKPDGRYSGVEQDSEVLNNAQSVASWRGVRMPAVVLTTAITCAASIVGTYLATHKADQPADCASRADMNAVQKQVEELTNTQRSMLATMGHNAEAAHAENVITNQSLQSLRDLLSLRPLEVRPDAAMSNAIRGR